MALADIRVLWGIRVSGVEIKTLMPNAQVSNVKVDVLSAKRRSNLPASLFNVK